MAPRASIWNHESDKDLLLTIIAGRKLDSIIWKDIAEKMVEAGYTFTQEACRQHFQKIRRGSNAPRKERGLAATPNTPNKRKAPSAKSTPANSQSQAQSRGEDDDEQFNDESPSKKAKVKKERMNERAPVFKVEEKNEMAEDGNGDFTFSQGVIDLVNDDLYTQDY